VQIPITARRNLNGTATVMVVDDEQIVRQTAKAMLERYGYTVVFTRRISHSVDPRNLAQALLGGRTGCF
jgi:CheY-like chemotaxis protein